MRDFSKRNWPQDILLTLAATALVIRGVFAIENAVDSLTQPQIAATKATEAEDPLEALRHDPTTAGAFVPIAASASTPPSTATAESKELWRSNDELAVDTIAWGDSPLTRIHRH